MMRLSLSRFAFLLISLGFLSFGCAVGPDFHPPRGPETASYTATALPPTTAEAPGTGGAPQRFATGQDVPGQWWTLFRSDALDGLIRQALADNPTLAASEATLRQAQETARAQFGAFFPSVNLNVSAEREKFSGTAFGGTRGATNVFNLYNASVSVSYLLDVFGGVRRQLEASNAQVDYQDFELEAAYLTITSNVVTTAVQEASLRAQIGVTRELVALQQEQLKVVQSQHELGAVSLSDVLAQNAQLAQTRATLPPLEKQLTQTRHLLAVLAGKFPSEAIDLPAFSLDELHLPEELPVSLPSDLVRQRPDIRASEALLHAASASVGVATSNLYPQITLTGSYGPQTDKLHEWFNTNNAIWNFGGGLLQPLFRGGALRAQKRAAEAAYQHAAAQYRETVLQAFQNVADVLRALETDARTLQAQAEAEAAARESMDLTDKQFRLGAVSYLALLNAQRQYQQSRISLVQAQAARFADSAALFQALGGGWWNRSLRSTDMTGMVDGGNEGLQ